MTKQAYRQQIRLAPIGAAGIEQCRAIVREHQYRKVNEVMIDGFSASAIVAVHDKLNEQNRAKLEALPVGKVASVCFKLCK